MGDRAGSGQIIGRHLDHLRAISFVELLHAQVSPELQLSLNCVLKVNGLFPLQDPMSFFKSTLFLQLLS